MPLNCQGVQKSISALAAIGSMFLSVNSHRRNLISATTMVTIQLPWNASVSRFHDEALCLRCRATLHRGPISCLTVALELMGGEARM